jgi:hypothetical protein
MKFQAKVLDSKTSNNKVIMIEVSPLYIYKAMEMLSKAGFEVDYRKCDY